MAPYRLVLPVVFFLKLFAYTMLLMSWFSQLTGISVETPQAVKENLSVEGSTLVSRVNGRRFQIGQLTTPSLSDLRNHSIPKSRNLSVREVVADVQDLHLDPANAGALFQVASQFNLLEMIGPSVVPEDGVGRYEDDRTQGPACAIACGAGTIYRNYFCELGTSVGQTTERQIDCLAELGNALGNSKNKYWAMRNGYAIPTRAGLSKLNEFLSSKTEQELDQIRGALRIGVQSNTQVTLKNCSHLVTQTYCSALPVAYSNVPPNDWQPFANLALEGAYEATLYTASQNAALTGNNRVFLTLLGGGAFGNKDSWIVAAILRALDRFSSSGLDVRLVSYGRPSPVAAKIVEFFGS